MIPKTIKHEVPLSGKHTMGKTATCRRRPGHGRPSGSVCIKHISQDVAKRVTRAEAAIAVKTGLFAYCTKTVWRQIKKGQPS